MFLRLRKVPAFFKVGSLVVLCWPLAGALASTEIIGSFVFSTCLKEQCIEIRAGEARKSPLEKSWVFLKSTLRVYRNVPDTTRKPLIYALAARSGYYDLENDFIVLRADPKAAHSQDVIIDLRDDGRITLMKPPVRKHLNVSQWIFKTPLRICRTRQAS
jgi:hypothetical protein